MNKTFEEKVKATLWVAHTLFAQGLVNGSSGNISFYHEGSMYISKSGSCFGRLNASSFARVALNDKQVDTKASKEYPMHKALYLSSNIYECVIHTHSIYSTSFACEKEVENKINELYSYTPYLGIMSNHKIECVKYAKPGSKQLFDNFEACVKEDTQVYLLKNHGVIIGAKDIYKGYNLLVELEYSAKMRRMMNECNANKII